MMVRIGSRYYVSIHASPQRQGELVILLLFEVCKFVSIHASPQRQGERACSYVSVRIEPVSIHASPQRQGEPLNKIIATGKMRFNPRLTSAARRTGCRLMA